MMFYIRSFVVSKIQIQRNYLTSTLEENLPSTFAFSKLFFSFQYPWSQLRFSVSVVPDHFTITFNMWYNILLLISDSFSCASSNLISHSVIMVIDFGSFVSRYCFHKEFFFSISLKMFCLKFMWSFDLPASYLFSRYAFLLCNFKIFFKLLS